jgi:hypothetical protein
VELARFSTDRSIERTANALYAEKPMVRGANKVWEKALANLSKS